MPAEVVLQLTSRSRTALDAFKKIQKLESEEQERINANRWYRLPENAPRIYIVRLRILFARINFAPHKSLMCTRRPTLGSSEKKVVAKLGMNGGLK